MHIGFFSIWRSTLLSMWNLDTYVFSRLESNLNKANNGYISYKDDARNLVHHIGTTWHLVFHTGDTWPQPCQVASLNPNYWYMSFSLVAVYAKTCGCTLLTPPHGHSEPTNRIGLFPLVTRCIISLEWTTGLQLISGRGTWYAWYAPAYPATRSASIIHIRSIYTCICK